ncbi:hypothetical protein FB45DRAFT_870646 [Roridomyces roridus]|uniref:F-box domain-containing protein n=1 Tax=Roridomyces roridus TaxID=1738132 RepID=A0AAD7BJC2_9AGAR|nr:hypothetical protein FB45DRAFT_870646 [Roridomyces roridus]
MARDAEYLKEHLQYVEWPGEKTQTEVAEANIALLTTEIAKLAVLRQREVSVLATLRAMAAPVTKLPIELLIEIFKLVVHTEILGFALEWDRLFDHHAGSTALKKILPLLQVSRHWRQVVHTTPGLWAEGVIELHRDRVFLSGSYKEGLEVLLARSARSPISLSLYQGQSAAPFFEGIVARTADRLLNLSIHLPSFPQLDLCSRAFEALERLLIADMEWQENPVTVFQHSPQLKHLVFCSVDSQSKIGLFHMPWGQLTVLTIVDESLGACREALMQCTSLVAARITTSHLWDCPLEAAQTSVVELPFLEALTVVFSGQPRHNEIGGLEAFLSPFALPFLRSLNIRFDCDSSENWPVQVFHDFQLRSPNITDLKFNFCPLEAENLIDILRQCVCLESLRLAYAFRCLTEDFLRAFTYNESNTTLAPQLQSITLYAVCCHVSCGSLLEEAIRSRWWTDATLLSRTAPPRVKCLKEVAIFDSDFSEQFEDSVQDLEEQGLLHWYWNVLLEH